MDCPSSDEGAFNTPLQNGKQQPDPTSLSANEMSQRYESAEMVFSSSPPRGPLATLTKGQSNTSSTVDASLDMIKISLKDSNEEYTDNDSKEQMVNNMNTSDSKTILTVISSETSKPNIEAVGVQHLNIANKKEIRNIDSSNITSDDEYSSLDRTIVDSELPSLPTDYANTSGQVPENTIEESKQIDIQSADSAEQSTADTEPISLSDIKLIENSQ